MKKLTIESPCHENWNEFTPKAEGGFCISCQKTVVDFTDKSNEEIKDILEAKTAESLCGRIAKNQLEDFNKDYYRWHNNTDPKVIQSQFLWVLILAFGLSLFNMQVAQVQHIFGKIAYTEQTDTIKPIEKINSQEIKQIDTNLVEEFIMGDMVIEEPTDIKTLEEFEQDSTHKNTTSTKKKCKTTKDSLPSHLITMGIMMIDEPMTVDKKSELKPLKTILMPPIIGHIYPNPVTRITTLFINITEPGIYKISIINNEGKIVKMINDTFLEFGKQNFSLDFSDFKGGIYHVNITSKNHLSTLKLTKV